MKIAKITRVAGASLLGFCAVSLAADKISLTPLASQIAGFAGAFLWVAGRTEPGSEEGVSAYTGICSRGCKSD